MLLLRCLRAPKPVVASVWLVQSEEVVVLVAVASRREAFWKRTLLVAEEAVWIGSHQRDTDP